MSKSELSAYEQERQANIARNRALLEQLDIQENVSKLGISTEPRKKAVPIQPAKRVKREKKELVPRRQSQRLRGSVVDPNESPSKKRKREAEEQERLAKEAEERLLAEERERIQKRPRHHDLELSALLDDDRASDLSSLVTTWGDVSSSSGPSRIGDNDAFVYKNDHRDQNAVNELKEKLQNLSVVARAKVTQDRIYTAAYHPEVTKDLIFFGDKHGSLGIWDARAPPDEVADEDDNATATGDKEGGKYWRLQLHWPATSKSSISCIKIDPINVHNVVYTSSYDCTIRALSFPTGISREIFTTEDMLISSIDLTPSGNEMWISDASGGLTHLDLREDKSKAMWYGLSDAKIGTVSINPRDPSFLLTASNNRVLKIWDARKLRSIATIDSPVTSLDDARSPLEFDAETVESFIQSPQGRGCLRGAWSHDKSVSSAYWDPHGRRVVSTSYDDSIRLWDIDASRFKGSNNLSSFRPFVQLKHNCQTGKWLTILRAQWTRNPDVYPHFTIGNMNHSLDIISSKGDLIARLSDPGRITAVQAVTCSHPSVLERAVSGNASGRCVLWAPPE